MFEDRALGSNLSSSGKNACKSPNARILLWWDIDKYIGQYRKSKVTARPLRAIENELGLRMRVEDHSRFSLMPKGVWKFEAYSYLNTTNSALAASWLLNKLCSMTDWLSGFGYKNVVEVSEDSDENEICTFYWQEYRSEQPNCYSPSGGVKLLLTKYPPEKLTSDSSFWWHEGQHNQVWKRRPTVDVTPYLERIGTFTLTLTILHACNNRQKLISHHWPKLKAKYKVCDDDEVNFGSVPKDGKPNAIVVKKQLADMPEYEAIVICLSYVGRCRFRLRQDEGVLFEAERFPGSDDFDGISAIQLTRAGGN